MGTLELRLCEALEKLAEAQMRIAKATEVSVQLQTRSVVASEELSKSTGTLDAMVASAMSSKQ